MSEVHETPLPNGGIVDDDRQWVKLQHDYHPSDEAVNPAHVEAARQLARLVQSDHWLQSYVRDLLAAHQVGEGVDFQTARLLLDQEEQAFEKDLAIARKFVNRYPHLFK